MKPEKNVINVNILAESVQKLLQIVKTVSQFYSEIQTVPVKKATTMTKQAASHANSLA